MRGTRTPALASLGVAILALVVSAIAAIGPANEKRATYSWPAALPHERAERGWYAPLPLLNRVPEGLKIHVPCGLSPELRPVRPATVLATARHTGRAGGLSIELLAESLRISVGSRMLTTIPWPAACPLDVDVRDGTLRAGPKSFRLRTATLDHMPIVTGLFSDLDLRAGRRPSVEVRTRPYDASATTMQWIAAAFAVILALVAAIIACRTAGRAAGHERRRDRRRFDRVTVSLPDGVVVGLLMVWWILAPTLTDDGWIWTQLQTFDVAGATHFYFGVWGAEVPVGYWADWARHWSTTATRELVFLRLPTLAALIVSWFLCRSCLRRAVGALREESARWILAAAFLTGAFAWGMTLRMEPFLSLMALLVLVSTLSFFEERRLAPLAIATMTSVLAATAHPAGLVAAAPLLATLPTAVRWLHRGEATVALASATIAVAALALGVTSMTLDSDARTRADLVSVARANDAHGEPFWNEYLRYTRFDDYGAETAVRHLSLALLWIAVAVFLLRQRRRPESASLHPARSLALGLLLLALVPSKWPWHFGVLIGVGAVAFATEAVRFQRATRRSLVSVVVLVLVAELVLWSWNASGPWSRLDLLDSTWSVVFGFSGLGLFFASLIVAAAIAPPMGRWLGPTLPFRLVVVACCVAIGLTSTVLAVDALRSEWTVGRQNLDALSGGQGCGLADEFAPRDERLGRLIDGRAPALIAPDFVLDFPCAASPAPRDGLVETPAVVVVGADRWLLRDRDAPFTAISDLYPLAPVQHGPGEMVVLAVDHAVPGYVRTDVRRSH